MTLPRGIRSNNPGNIRVGDPWQGLMPRDQMNDAQKREKEFCVFSEPKWGIRALCRLLIAYKDKHKLDTVRGIITRWAPPKGKVGSKTYTQNTEAYIAQVSVALGVSDLTKIDVYQYDIAKPLVKAIIKHENGVQPYDDDTINEGIRLAGIEVPVKPLSQSREIKGAQVAGVASLGGIGVVISEAAGVIQPLVQHSQAVLLVFLVLVLAGAGFTIWARMRVNAEGVR
jgi:hypothetical protein